MGIPASNMSDVSFGIGAELQGEYMFSKNVSATFTTGYTSFMEKKAFKDASYSNTGYIPFLAGVRFYAAPQFFVGGRIGYGLLTSKGGSTGAFNYEHQIGFNADKFQIVVGYNALKKNIVTINDIGITGVYKFN
ncbi:MAG: hypothetical protein C4329_14550 [Chitinophagaceae bacterium]